jgi:hypothetical protein
MKKPKKKHPADPNTIRQTLRVTPAMEAGITDHVWTLEEVVALTNQD